MKKLHKNAGIIFVCKDFAKNKLAPFKIPRNIYFLKDIPVGATGKIQRIGLAKKLGLEK